MANETDSQIEQLIRTALGNRLRGDGMEEYWDGPVRFRGAPLKDLTNALNTSTARSAPVARVIKPVAF